MMPIDPCLFISTITVESIIRDPSLDLKLSFVFVGNGVIFEKKLATDKRMESKTESVFANNDHVISVLITL